MNTKQQFIIMSASTLDKTIEQNKVRHENLLSDIISFKLPLVEVNGSYKGNKEMGVLVKISNYLELDALKALGRLYNQESILYSDSNGLVSLEYMQDSESSILGKMQEVDNVNGYESYTELNNKFYVVN